MTNGWYQTSPQAYARLGGILYLVIIVCGLAGEMLIRGPMVVSGDAAATAANIAASSGLWRLGIAGDLVMHMCDIGVMFVFYALLRPVSRPLATVAILLNLVQTAVLVVNKTALLMPLFLLGNAAYLKAFTIEQLQALSYVALRMHDYGFGFGLIFFGLTCLVVGHLIVCSTYLPAMLGRLMQLAGVCYLLNSFTLILWPSMASNLSPFILLPPFVAELSLALWLVMKGVNLAKWRAVVSGASV